MKNLSIGLGIVAVVGLGIYAAWFFLIRDTSTPVVETVSENEEPEPYAPTGDAPEEAAPAEEPETVEETLPAEPPEDLTAADSFLRERFQDRDPLIDEFLIRDDLVRKLVTAVDLAGRDKNPRGQLEFLTLGGTLQVQDREGRLFLSSDNFKRYDRYMGALDQMDIGFLAKVYRHLAPLCRLAYEELGNEDITWDDRLEEVLDSLIEMEVPEGEPELKRTGDLYVFADPRLEALPPVDKAFIRMGSENARKLQEKLRQFRNGLQ